jgi:hypothetical protein
MNWVRTSVALAGVVIAWGLGWQPDPAVDSIKILSISPTTQTALRIGETLTLQAEVEYNLTSAESGTVTLVIQQENQVARLSRMRSKSSQRVEQKLS